MREVDISGVGNRAITKTKAIEIGLSPQMNIWVLAFCWGGGGQLEAGKLGQKSYKLLRLAVSS